MTRGRERGPLREESGLTGAQRLGKLRKVPMEERTERIQKIVESVGRPRLGGRSCHVLRVPPAGEGPAFIGDVAASLTAAGHKVIHLELPDYDLDAVEHVLGQLCQHLGLEAVPGRAWDYRRPVHERVAEVTREMKRRAADAHVLLAYVPRSWFRRPQDPRRSLPDNPTSVLDALLDPELDTVVAASETHTFERRLKVLADELPLPAAAPGYLSDPARWASDVFDIDLARDALHLSELAGDLATARPPLVLDLGVACLSLGCPEVIQALRKPDAYPDLVAWLRQKVKTEHGWSGALGRLGLPRFPVPESVLLEATGALADPQRVIAQCLVQRHGAGLRAHEALREVVRASRREPEAHRRLMEHHAESVAASSPREAAQEGSLLSLLETEHHGAHAGPAIPAPAHPLSRLIKYERAWSWSYEFKEHTAAASLYEDLLREDPGDAYSHHYLAWNLDQAGKDGRTARREYQQAIDLERDNPWYNSRYITFLRDNGFRRDARDAWQRAKQHVLTGSWASKIKLPIHFHYWIARSAIDVGDLDLARDVLGTLTTHDVDKYKRLSELREELAQYEEIARLGEPVYPAEVPVSERWGAPQLLPDQRAVKSTRGKSSRLIQARLVDWHPGRVHSIENGTVTLVLSDRAEKSLFIVEVSEGRLEKIAGGVPAQVGRFLEYGIYEGSKPHVQYHPRRRRSREEEDGRFEHGMRHLREDTSSEHA